MTVNELVFMSVKNETIDETGISKIKHSNRNSKMESLLKLVTMFIIMYANIPVEGQNGLETDTGI